MRAALIIAPCTAAKTNLSRLGHGGEEFQPTPRISGCSLRRVSTEARAATQPLGPGRSFVSVAFTLAIMPFRSSKTASAVHDVAVVRHNNQSVPPAPACDITAYHASRILVVQISSWLVCKPEKRIVRQGSGNCDALLFTTAQARTGLAKL